MARGESIVVREANRGDLEGLLDLYVEFYNELRSRQGLRPRGREDYRDDVERYLSQDKVFLAETSSGEAVGFIRVSEREGCYWLEELYVKPEHRGKSVGRWLVEKVEDYIREHDSYVYNNGSPPGQEGNELLAPHGLPAPEHSRAGKEPRRKQRGDKTNTTTKQHTRNVPMG